MTCHESCAFQTNPHPIPALTTLDTSSHHAVGDNDNTDNYNDNDNDNNNDNDNCNDKSMIMIMILARKDDENDL